MSLRIFNILLFFGANVICFFNSCVSGSEYYRSYPDLYKPSAKNEFKIQFAIVHLDEKLSWLEYEFPSRQLVYKNTDTDTMITATAKISVHLQAKFGLKKMNDTTNYIIRDHVKSISDHAVRGRVKINVPPGKWFMELNTLDMNSGLRGTQSVFIRKENIFSAQNFSTEVAGDGLFVNPYMSAPAGLLISSERKKNVAKLYVDYFKNNSQPAAPPYALSLEQTFNYRPDSSFVLLKSDTSIFKLVVDKPGYFHCRIDTNMRDGITYFYFYRNYPSVSNYAKMIETARYMMTEDEYNAANAAADKKETVEKFWLRLGGSAERAKALIAAWYGRVENANTYFSTQVEGWKTDRGMIHIVFGPPKNIYKTSETETWVYGDERSAKTMTFSFRKIYNPFTENDFVLERSSSYRNQWFTAVDNWRQGRVFDAN